MAEARGKMHWTTAGVTKDPFPATAAEGPRAGDESAGSAAAADALRAELWSQYLTVRRNEEGILDDTDTESLHDFRVAVRRARSVFGQFGGVFAPEPAARLRRVLSWFGRSTGKLRDLHVYLAHEAAYRGMLSGPLAQDLAPLFDFVRRERGAALRGLADVMRSPEYEAALRRWRECVEDPAAIGPRGSEPVLRLAGARVAKKCRAVLEQGHRLRGRAAAADLHSLRIECKKLRYLLEMLADLMPEARAAVHGLKKLQDALGRIQDLTVHESRSLDFARAASSAGSGGVLPAVEVLASRMRVERELACAEVPGLVARFDRGLRGTEPPYVMLLPWLRRIREPGAAETSPRR